MLIFVANCVVYAALIEKPELEVGKLFQNTFSLKLNKLCVLELYKQGIYVAKIIYV